MLAIAGGKGGCGKTTTTLGIAAALAETDHRVLAIDADRDMPDLHVLAGVPGAPTAAAVADGTPIASVAGAVPDRPAIGIVPAAPGVSRADLRATIRAGRRQDAVGLIDCPAGAGRDAVAPLRAATAAVVVTTSRPAAIRDAAKTAAVARAVGTPVICGVVTRARSVPRGVERLLGTSAVAVGPIDEPVSPAGVRAHREIAGRTRQELFSGSACN
jgi:septum site-determining protein MinD